MSRKKKNQKLIFPPGTLVKHLYDWSIHVETSIEQKSLLNRIVWHQHELGVILEGEYQHLRLEEPMRKVLIPRGICFISETELLIFEEAASVK